MGTTPNVQQGGNDIVTTISKYGKIQNVIYKSTVNFAYQNGYVCNVEPEVGSLVDALDDYTITIYYAYNPVYETVANGSVYTTSNNAKKTTKTTKTTAKTVLYVNCLFFVYVCVIRQCRTFFAPAAGKCPGETASAHRFRVRRAV